MSKSDSLQTLTSLNLDLNSSDGKKIKFIEKLDHLRNLQMLKLSHNVIERIEKLQQLTQLRELDLSYNRIKRIEGLDTLVLLRSLRLRGNLVETVPPSLPKKLKDLQIIDLAENRIATLQEITRLKTLSNLHQVDVRDNPLMSLPHAWLFLVFHMSTLDQLNGVQIEAADRQQASERFQQSEITRLQQLVDEREHELQTLKEKVAKHDHDAKLREERERDLHKKMRKGIQERQEMQEKLRVQEALLKRKSEELMQACNKHYELEQELAFYKIDSKFHYIGRPPTIPEDVSFEHSTEGSDSGDFLTDSPYLGKGRFAENKFATLRKTPNVHMQQATLTTVPESLHPLGPAVLQVHGTNTSEFTMLDRSKERRNSTPSVSGDTIGNMETRVAAMKRLLEEKQNQILDAEKQLSNLLATIAHLTNTSVGSVQEDSVEPAGLTEGSVTANHSQDLLRDRLQEDINSHLQRLHHFSKTANHLRSEIQVVEDDLVKGLSDIELLQQQQEQAQENPPFTGEDKKGKVGISTQGTDPALLVKKMEEKSVQMTSTEQRLVNLKSQLEKVLVAIQRETDVIQHLEKRIVGSPTENGSPTVPTMFKATSVIPEQMSAELNALVTGLKGHFEKSKEIESSLEKRRENEGESLLHIQRRLAAEKARNAQLLEQLQALERMEASQSEKSLLLERDFLKSQETVLHLKAKLKDVFLKAEAEKEDMEAQLEAERERTANVEQHQRINARVRARAVSLENLNRELSQRVSRLSLIQKTLRAASEQEILHWSSAIRDWTERLQSGENVQDIVHEVDATTLELLEEAVEQHTSLTATEPFLELGADDGVMSHTVPRLNAELHNLLVAATNNVKRNLRQQWHDYQYATEKEMHQLREQVLQYMEEMEEAHYYGGEIPRRNSRPTEQLTSPDNTSSRPQSVVPLPLVAAPAVPSLNLHSARNAPSASGPASSRPSERTGSRLVEDFHDGSSPRLPVNTDEDREQRRTEHHPQTVLHSPNVNDVGAQEYAQYLLRMLDQTKRTYSKEMAHMHQEIARLQDALMERSRKDPSGTSSVGAPRVSVAAQAQSEDTKEAHVPLSTRGIQTTSRSASRKASISDQPHSNAEEVARPNSTAAEDEFTNTFPTLDAVSLLGSEEFEVQPPTLPAVTRAIQHSSHSSKPKTLTKSALPVLHYSPVEGISRRHPLQTSTESRPSRASKHPTSPAPVPRLMELERRDHHPTYSTPHHEPDGGSSSEERGLLMELKHELDRLRRQLEITERTHQHKMDTAMQHIGTLESELVRRETAERLEQEEMTRAAWEKYHLEPEVQVHDDSRIEQLNETLRELDACQQNIVLMQKRLDERSSQTKTDSEMQQLRDIMNEQKKEIVRLNALLDRLAGVRIVEGLDESPSAGMVPAVWPPTVAPQRPATVMGSSPYPFGQLPPQPGPFGSHRFSGSAHIGGPLHSSSTPMLFTAPNVTEGTNFPGGGSSLYCNVPEHHHLEDYLQQLCQKNSSLKKELKEKRVLHNEEELHTVQKLRQDIDKKKDTLSELTIEIERRQMGVEQLLTREKHLLKAVEELQLQVTSLQQQHESMDSEAILQERREMNSMKQATEKQSYLQEEIQCLEATLAQRHAEMKQVERQLAEAREDLQTVREESRDTIVRFDEARQGYFRTILECEELEKRAREAGQEVVKCNSDTVEARQIVKALEVQKRQLQLSLEDVKRILQSKDEEYQELERQLVVGTASLKALHEALSLVREQEQQKMECIQEADHLILERRQEAELLQMQIQEQRVVLEKLAIEIGERKAELQILETQIHRRQEDYQRSCRELELELASKKGQIEDAKSLMEKLQEAQSHLRTEIDHLESEQTRTKRALLSEKEALRGLQSQVQQLQCERDQLQQRLPVQQHALDEVKRQCNEKSAQFLRLTEEMSEKQATLEEVEDLLQRKRGELETLREQITSEKGELEKVTDNKESIRATLKHLKDEKNLLAEQKSQLETRIQTLSRESSHLEERLTNTKSRLDTARNDLASAEQATLETKRDRDRVLIETRHSESSLQNLRSAFNREQARHDACVADFHKVMQQVHEQQKTREQLQSEIEHWTAQVRSQKMRSEELETQLQTLHEEKESQMLLILQRQEELRKLTQTLAEMKCNSQMEQDKVSRLLEERQNELATVMTQVEQKQKELHEITKQLRDLRNQMVDENRTLEQVEMLESSLKQKEYEVNSNHEDKHQLAEALQRSYAELQALRGDLSHEREERERLVRQFTSELQAAREALQEQDASQSAKLRKAREESQLAQQAAEEFRARTLRLAEELNQSRHDFLMLRRQVQIFSHILDDSSSVIMAQHEFLQHQRHLDLSLRAVKADLEMDATRNKTFRSPSTTAQPVSVTSSSPAAPLDFGLTDTGFGKPRGNNMHSAMSKLERDADEFHRLTSQLRSPASHKSATKTPLTKLFSNSSASPSHLLSTSVPSQLNGHHHSTSSVEGLQDRLMALVQQYTSPGHEDLRITSSHPHQNGSRSKDDQDPQNQQDTSFQGSSRSSEDRATPQEEEPEAALRGAPVRPVTLAEC